MCKTWITLGEAAGFESARVGGGSAGGVVASEIRNSWRCLLFSNGLASDLFQRLRRTGCLPELVLDPYGQEWKLEGLNARLSFLKYEYPDHRFVAHSDGVTRFSECENKSEKLIKRVQSFFTV